MRFSIACQLSAFAGFVWGWGFMYVVTRKCSPNVDIIVGKGDLNVDLCSKRFLIFFGFMLNFYAIVDEGRRKNV